MHELIIIIVVGTCISGWLHNNVFTIYGSQAIGVLPGFVKQIRNNSMEEWITIIVIHSSIDKGTLRKVFPMLLTIASHTSCTMYNIAATDILN